MNPTEGLSLPAVRGRRDRVARPAESRALIGALPREDRAVWATALYAGLRRGELAALRWPAVLAAVAVAPPLSRTQRRVLVALCRPCKGAVGPSAPASNREIAEELHLSVEAVKAHLRALFSKFSVPDLPHNRKRLRLVAEAFSTWAISPREPPTQLTTTSLPANAAVPGRRGSRLQVRLIKAVIGGVTAI